MSYRLIINEHPRALSNQNKEATKDLNNLLHGIWNAITYGGGKRSIFDYPENKKYL